MIPEIECITTEGTVIPIQDYQSENVKKAFQVIAVEKIIAELKNFTGGLKEKCVSTNVAAQVTHFCEESSEFAEVAYKTKRTLSDCCTEVLKPFFTTEIDMDEGRIRQLYGFSGSSAPKEVRVFTEEFVRAAMRWRIAEKMAS